VEYRYRDKVYLSTYFLDTELFDQYDFLVEDATPIRTVYILKTDQGMKILKKVDYSVEELMFLYQSLNKIRKSYPYVVNFKETLMGKPYVEYMGGVYVVLDIIEGRECIYENPIDLMKTATALAKFHSAGENIEIFTCRRNQLGRMQEKFKDREKDLEKYKEIANLHIYKSEFDSLYLDFVDYYIECIRKARIQLENSPYREICMVTHTLCHHDLAHHNILIGNDDNVYFIDFDYALIDLPYHDLANMMTKAIKHNGWNIDIADSIMEAYCSERVLSKEEISVLYGYLLFPLDFYDISTSYYMRTRNWDEEEFVDKLRRKGEYREEREAFLKEFKKRWLD
jgi:CotS family spore coat protein